MRKCNAKPYEGNEPYVFVSYSHSDSGMVFPVIEYLAKKGYRIWYDNGIHPGNDWLETIGQHVAKCSVFMSFISPRSLMSHNCKNEFNFATIENKSTITVILEPVQLSMALKMQMATIQGIIRYEYSDFEQYAEKFLQSDILEKCLGEPDSSIEVLKEVAFDENVDGPSDKSAKHSSFNWFKNDYRKASSISTAEEKSGKIDVSEEDISEDNDALTVEIPDDDDDDGVTIVAEEDDERTSMYRTVFVLTLRENGDEVEISHSEYTVGRKCKNGQADFMVVDPMKNVSRNHMTFILDGEKCFIKDNGAINGTILNGEALKKDTLYPVHEGDVIVMGYEKFTFDVSTVLRKFV